MEHWLQNTLGFVFTFVAGFSVRPFLRWIRALIPVPEISPDPFLVEWWGKLRAHPKWSGIWVGILERIVFFWALLLEKRWEAVGVWVAFKVAAKWEAWNHMGYVPDKPDDKGSVPSMVWAHARRVWAAQGYATFVVGTAANLLLAEIGVLIATNGGSAISWICHASGVR